MGFHVDYDELDQMYSRVYGNAHYWNEALTEFSRCVKELASSHNISGDGAENIKTYIDSVHNTIAPVIGQLITAHINNCLLYIRNYQSEIDTGLHSIISEEEIVSIKNKLALQSSAGGHISASVQSILRSVSDLIYVTCPGYETVDDYHSDIDKLLSDLLTDVRELEDRHYQNDFINTTQLIEALTCFINERLSDSRIYKTNFSLETLAESASFIALHESYVAISAEIESNQAAVDQAIEDENARIEALQAEIEERQKKATAEKWAVTGLCVVGSVVAIAVIVGSGGTATPLVVGTVSAVSGAVMAGNNVAADEYVEHGWNTNTWDMKSIGTSALLGSATGFITGYVGVGIDGAISGGLAKTAVGSALLNSSSTAVRIGANAFIGSISQVASGVATRGASTFVTTMVGTGGVISTSINAAWDSATDGQQILFDAAIGGVVGGIKGLKKPTTVSPLDDISENSEEPYYKQEGGSYKELNKANPGRRNIEEIHHMPADSINGLKRNDGPAIIMDYADHKCTASYDHAPGADAYRLTQKQLIESGNFMDAFNMDVNDIQTLFGSKYNDAIEQARNYLEEMIRTGVIK